jgi:hypothetical protein
MERHTARYASFDSTRDGLRRVDRAEAYRTAVRHKPAGHRSRPSLRTLHAADGGKQGAVGGLELGGVRSPAEHGELVAEHQDLQVLAASLWASSTSRWIERHSAR